MVIRGHVTTQQAQTGGDVAMHVHVDKWLKGTGPGEMDVDFGGLRPVTTSGMAELFFLGPGFPHDGGVGPDRCLQEPAERWEVPDGATGAIDQAMSDFLSHQPDSRVLADLVSSGGRLAAVAAGQLSLLASRDPKALEDAELAVRDPRADAQARADLIRMLPSRLSPETLQLTAQNTQPPMVRLNAIQAIAHSAANEPSRREAAIPILLATAKDQDPNMQFVAATGLAELGRPEALPVLDGVLAGSDIGARREAVRALAQLAQKGNSDAKDRLTGLQQDKDAEVQSRARNLLKTLPSAVAPAQAHAPNWALPLGIGVVLLGGGGLFFLSRRKKA
jgi:LPXTG-motif cell wall-anchored protein